ncbi:TPA: hypothetical protein DDW69_04185 [candidate division CPR2 bacterium]|uniref:Zn-dependent hydrolase of the beta-lactamase fold-like protein n=1 Tax=candidate division CPR2 bacterium GW2011_GWC1_41_48 TaxID=1618344 RepID=A0A0G0W8E5_UNCC2|nr:MAG: hypothetical protein UT47_C0002G0276 [candidate division CPR2 bacterium GW2011_GWC2_39_35]KKR27276.1 MAG: hypothetical protein UT60_C0055G0003 [candidate division CPR2 bacterium GW2011_GWD2_39_7]KKR28161.1 MAG: hypothetical protein UT59_C0034G0009 [candidate division CPR2 bacterium GW2011_GWD1_39_7]KKS09250.1 MAG: hypothetical protein UU65_C0002G0028 [candidate division CPR2 bacterium GW2011_GWC1_41_48]OGB60310.1 MAG: hypothetical protein A2Y27_00470 [candidate division CPR2 bacterium G
MEIIWYGQSAFKLTGKNITIFMDPYSEPEKYKWKPIKTAADVVIITHDHWDHNNVAAISGDPVVFDMPGDYEVKGITFKGIESRHGADVDLPNTMFVIKIDDMTVAHLGDLGESLSSTQLEKLNGVDVLLVPVGGTYTLDDEEAVGVVNQIEPKIIIPMHYGPNHPELLPVDNFVKEIGMEPEKTAKLKIVKKDLPEEPKLVILEIQ